MDEGGELFQRASLFNTLRDNQALMMIDKNTEDFKNVTASLGGVSDIVRQSMERLTLPSQIPVVKFFGDQPAGLSATSEGVIRMFYDGIKAKQEARNRKVIQQIVELVQIELFGEVIDDIEWTFNDLWQLDEAGKAGIQKTKADTRAVDLEAGLITPEEGREVLARDPDSQYTGLDLSEPIPQQPQEGEEDLSDEEGGTTPAEGATPHPGASGSAPQQPGEPKLSPSKRDFASSVTSAAAKFGGAATNGLPAKDKDLGLDEELGEDKKAFEWEEELHPRDESGKFAPKGNASISLHKMLLSKGFQQHPESPHAIYTHSSGHQIAFAPKSVHNAHSYQFAAYKDFTW